MLPMPTVYPQFTDSSGTPLESGFIYVGEANKNPETNPISVYWDAAGTQPAAQPLRTSGGYIVRNGSPSMVFINNDCSISVKDKKNNLVYYAASTVAYSQTFSQAITYPAGTLGAHANTYKTVMDAPWSAVADGNGAGGGTDASLAIQAAIDAMVATGKSGELHVPAGTYRMDHGLTIDVSVVTLKGDAALFDFTNLATGAAITLTGAVINYVGNPYYNGVNAFQGFKLIGPGSAVPNTVGIQFTGSGFLGPNDVAVRDCTVSQFAIGMAMGNVAYHLSVEHCSVFLCGVCVAGQSFVNAGARNVFNRCKFFNSDYAFTLQNAGSASTDVTDCVIAGIGLVCFLIDGGHLSVTNCDIEPGGSHPANYRTLWVTHNAYASYSYINWHGNQVSVKNATNVPIYGIDGAAILTMTGGYLHANPACTGGVFGSVGTGVGTIATCTS